MLGEEERRGRRGGGRNREKKERGGSDFRDVFFPVYLSGIIIFRTSASHCINITLDTFVLAMIFSKW